MKALGLDCFCRNCWRCAVPNSVTQQHLITKQRIHLSADLQVLRAADGVLHEGQLCLARRQRRLQVAIAQVRLSLPLPLPFPWFIGTLWGRSLPFSFVRVTIHMTQYLPFDTSRIVGKTPLSLLLR